MKNQVRIIAGKWRGRKIHFPTTLNLRPTPDRVRETLFNWLMKDIVGALCLDLFAGSAVLSFEALSRGAKQVIACENEPKALQSIEENKQKLQTTSLSLYHSNQDLLFTPDFLPPSPFDIIFLDPPFSENRYVDYFEAIIRKKLLKPTGLLYVEANIDIHQERLTHFIIKKQQRAGQIYFYLLQLKDY